MVSPDVLEKHVVKKLERGVSKSEVFKQLTSAGWPEDVIAQYIARTESDVVALSCIKIDGVSKSFDSNAVLNGVELVIPSGEILGVIGESGSGKSTLLNILVGFIEPDAGDVILTLENQPPVSIIKHPGAIKKLVGFSTQLPSFYGKLSVVENLRYFGSLYGLSGVELVERVNHLLSFVGLKEFKDSPAYSLAGSLQKKLDIACSIVNNPKLLILDEPVAGLDFLSAQVVLDLIRAINAEGTTVLLSSHVIDDAEAVCSKIAVLRDKKIVEVGSPDELRNIYSKNFQIVVETVNRHYSRLEKLLHGAKVVHKNDRLVISADHPDVLVSRLPSLVHKCDDKVKSVLFERPRLRDVFERLSQKSEKGKSEQDKGLK